MEQIELFRENLAHKPYCSDEKSFLKIRDKSVAELKKYIQHNQPTKIKWLVYDCDYACALDFISDNLLPPPNLIAINPVNHHSHLFYGLETPVCITDAGRFKPKDFLRKVSWFLGDLLKADKGYTNFISKNPLSQHWQVLQIEPKSYELADFLDWFSIPQKLPREYKTTGVGRNVTTFEIARRWSYRQVLQYRLTANRDGFATAVYQYCQEVNSAFPTPLCDSEVKAIAKSISNWTWKNYTARWSDEQFSAIQAYRGRLGGLKNGVANWNKREQAKEMRATGMTQRAIAEALGVSVGSVNSWLKS